MVRRHPKRPPLQHTPEQFGHKPYAFVRLVNDTATELYVPLHWFHRVQLARRATVDSQLLCFYSFDLQQVPNFRLGLFPGPFQPFEVALCYAVYVLKIVEGEQEHCIFQSVDSRLFDEVIIVGAFCVVCSRNSPCTKQNVLVT